MRLHHPLALLAVLALIACAPAADAAQRTRAPAEPTSTARVLHYWTPARMASARPLDLVLAGGKAQLRAGRPSPAASASFLTVPTPAEPPYSVNGRVFVKQGNLRGYCSGTAIDSPTRQLVLTAGHCVNNGHEGGRTVWSQYLEFVPALSAGKAPFGAFVAKRGAVYAPPQWTRGGNPDFDLGAFLTHPNKGGLNVADAVGAGRRSRSACRAGRASRPTATPATSSGCRAAAPPTSATTGSASPSPARRRWGSAATGRPAPAAAAG